MIDPNAFQSRITQLQTALSERMRARGATLEQQLRRVMHRLPRRQRRAASTILGAQDWMAHPKLARVLDFSNVNKAFTDLAGYLERIDPSQERKTAILRLTAIIVIRLALLAVLIHALVTWRDLV